MRERVVGKIILRPQLLQWEAKRIRSDQVPGIMLYYKVLQYISVYFLVGTYVLPPDSLDCMCSMLGMCR